MSVLLHVLHAPLCNVFFFYFLKRCRILFYYFLLGIFNCYRTNCTVRHDVMCMGNRKFSKKLRCNWTRGHKWSTALLLSITLGGFGADRYFYFFINFELNTQIQCQRRL